MKKVTAVSLGLENLEHIALKADEIKHLVIEDIAEQVVQLADGVYQFRSCNYLEMILSSNANHTYGVFGTPSNCTIFDRLFEVENPVGCIELTYEDDTCDQLYLSGAMEQIFHVDEYGDLSMVFCFNDEACDCGDCCAEQEV